MQERGRTAAFVAESIPTRRVFTLDHDDFSTYRVRRGHRHLAVEILR